MGNAVAGANISPNITFVVGPSGNVAFNGSGILGLDMVNASNNASLVIEAGGVVDLFPQTNAVNGNITVQSGGRLLLNDTNANVMSGIGTLRFLSGSIMEVSGASSNAISGTETFVTDPGTIIRIGASGGGGGIIDIQNTNKVGTRADLRIHRHHASDRPRPQQQL